MLTQNGENLAFFQNMDNKSPRDIVFGREDIGSVFTEHRKSPNNGEMTEKS